MKKESNKSKNALFLLVLSLIVPYISYRKLRDITLQKRI